MTISHFYYFKWLCLAALCTIFIIQKPTFPAVLFIFILLIMIGMYLHVKGKQHATVPLAKLPMVISFCMCFLLAAWILVINHSTTLFIGIFIFIIMLMYIIQQWMNDLHLQTVQIQQLKEDIEQFNESYHTVSAQRHDFMKHVVALSYLLDKEEMTEAQVYMQNLLPNYQWVNQPIAGEQGHIASLLLYYQQKAHDVGVTFNVSTAQPLTRIPLPPHEQVQLVGNLLENAVDAAGDVQSTHSYIALHTQIVSGLYKIELTNTTEQIPRHIVDDLFSHSRQSTKPHGQGIGTTIIANLVHSSNGTLKYTYYGDKLVIRIALPMVHPH